MRRLVLVALVLIGLLSGCAVPMKPDGDRLTENKHNYQKNYAIGISKTVTVGEAMVKVSDYWTRTLETPVFVPDMDVTVTSGRSVNESLAAGQKYSSKGRIEIDGVEFVVVPTVNKVGLHYAVLVNSDGSLHNKCALSGDGRAYVVCPLALTVSNPAVRLTRQYTQNVWMEKGYENFELLYTGVNSAGMNLTYREFSPEGIARVAFFQNLTYESGVKSISFKQFRIAIEKATSDSITYTVTADGR